MNTFDFWWRLLRPHALTASLVPVVLGSVYAFTRVGQLQWSLLLTMLLASFLIQTATNLFNEYYDYVRGLDTKDSVGIGGTIVHDGASPKFVLNLALGAYGVAGLLGLYICSQSSWYLLLIGAVCMLIGYLYTGGPYPISASPFGEIFAGGAMGGGITMITFYLHTGFVDWACFLISVPLVILIGLILTSNNIRDLVGDKANGRHTLAILLGHRKSVIFMALMMGLSYLWALGLVIFQGYSVFLLLSLLSLPKAIGAIRGFAPEDQQPKQMMPAMKLTAQTNTVYGLTYALGFLIGYLF